MKDHQTIFPNILIYGSVPFRQLTGIPFLRQCQESAGMASTILEDRREGGRLAGPPNPPKFLSLWDQKNSHFIQNHSSSLLWLIVSC